MKLHADSLLSLITDGFSGLIIYAHTSGITDLSYLHVYQSQEHLLIFASFLFQGPKLEPLKEDTLASTYKSVSHH